MTLSAMAHVPSPRLTAGYGTAFTVTTTVAAGSSTWPVSGGVWSYVFSESTDTTGGVTSVTVHVSDASPAREWPPESTTPEAAALRANV